jgi:hypothetical protein
METAGLHESVPWILRRPGDFFVILVVLPTPMDAATSYLFPLHYTWRVDPLTIYFALGGYSFCHGKLFMVFFSKKA